MLLDGSDLYRLGISYHSYGTVKKGRLVYGYYYLCDKITEEQKEALLSECRHVEFKTTSHRYAPELKRVCIIVLSKAQIKRLAA
jgi:hypothetical protein